jgi:arginase
MTTVLCVPQWQGSAADGNHLLPEGARQTAEVIEAERVIVAPVGEAGRELVDGVGALPVLFENARVTRDILDETDDFVITAGGDCGVDLAPVIAAHERYGDELTVLWLDAHPDLYGPGDLRSGAFHGMVLRTLLGDGPPALMPQRLLRPEQVRIAGIRTSARTEREFIQKHDLRTFGMDTLARAFEQLSGPVYVHIDLDVLDPDVFGSVCYPEPGGVAPDLLVSLLRSIDDVVGAALTEHAPRGHDAAALHR